MPVFARIQALAGLLVLSTALTAHAGPERPPGLGAARLEVQHGVGAESCPDLAALQQLVHHVRNAPSADASASSYRVLFARQESTYVATIHDPRDGSERSLSDQGLSCDALARAVAVTLALLLDAERAKPLPADPEPAVSADAASAPLAARLPAAKPRFSAIDRDVVATSERIEGEPPRLGLHASALLIAGVLAPLAPALEAGIGVTVRAWRVNLGALWAFEVERALGPGQVTTELRGGLLEGCVAPLRATATRLDLCSGLALGSLRAAAHSYSSDRAESRAWLAVPFGLTFSVLTEPIGWQAGSAVLLPLPAQRFAVDGVGTVYETPVLGGMFWLRLSVQTP